MTQLSCTLAMLCVLSIGAAHAAKPEAASPQVLAVGVRLTVNADGTPGTPAITAPSDLVAQLVAKQVATWRFTPAQWQGKAVAAPFLRYLDVQMVPTTSGGFALRMDDLSRGSFWGDHVPFQEGATHWRMFRAYVLYAYVAEIGVDGRILRSEALLPTQHSSQGSRQYADAIEEKMIGWEKGAPRKADDQAIACKDVFLEEHHPDHMGMTREQRFTGWAQEVDLSTFPADAVAVVRARLDALRNAGELCPTPVLTTVIAGKML